MLRAQAFCHRHVSSDTPTSSSYKGAPVLGLEITAHIQVVRSVQLLDLDSIHGVLIPVLKQDGHVSLPRSWGNFLGGGTCP